MILLHASLLMFLCRYFEFRKQKMQSIVCCFLTSLYADGHIIDTVWCNCNLYFFDWILHWNKIACPLHWFINFLRLMFLLVFWIYVRSVEIAFSCTRFFMYKDKVVLCMTNIVNLRISLCVSQDLGLKYWKFFILSWKNCFVIFWWRGWSGIVDGHLALGEIGNKSWPKSINPSSSNSHYTSQIKCNNHILHISFF